MNDSARSTTVVSLAERTSPLVGMVLADRYVLEQLLGEGGMGRVFLATDREVDGADRFVAIKVLGEVFREHPQALTVLKREAAQALKLSHPNIVRVHTFVRDGPHVFIVMEYVRGQTLDHFIKRHKQGVPFNDAWPIIRDCARALSYMHGKGIVHSDFKPGNVFQTEDDETKVLDLGLARTVDETIAINGRTRFNASAPASAQPIGLTPEYASCEMFEENNRPDPRDDIYALGCVAYELLTGHHPFQSSGTVRWAPQARDEKLAPVRPKRIRRRQWRALQQALSFDRARRTPSAEHLLAALDPRRIRNATPWIVLTLLLAAIAAVAGLQFRPHSADERFIDEQLASHPLTDRPAKPEDIRGWREQGEGGLELATSAFAEQNYDAAEYYLHNGPTSVRFSFERLLAKSSTAQDARAGAEGLLKLSKLYAVPAEALRTQDAPQALRWVCLGLSVDPYEGHLLSLYADLSRTVGSDIPVECERTNQRMTGPATVRP